MHYLRVLLAFAPAITTATALPSAKRAALAAPAPSLDEFLTEVDIETRRNIPRPRHVVKPRDGILYPRQNVSSTAPNATVEMCNLAQFKGDCANATWPVNTCIDLNGYAGMVQSFQPVTGYECLLTQGRCNVAMPYISVGSDESDTAGDDLSALGWIKESKSYICFTEIAALRRFVKMRLRTPVREATGVSATVDALVRDAIPNVKGELMRMWTFVKEVVENLQREDAKIHDV